VPPENDRRIGLVLQDRYKILSRIADGGMGAVYRGERVKLGKPVAVKFLHAQFASNRDFVRRFETEAHAMSRISHPHCTSVIDFGVEEGTPYIVMDFVTGNTLRDVLQEGPLGPTRAIDIVVQTLAGLSHAHSVGVIHRDVKPENIVLTASDEFGDHVRILDFGFAKLRDDSSLTAGLAVGTPSYMSPEQSTGGKIDVRTDVYQVGVVLFELLTGRKPFVGDDMRQVILAHQNQPAPRLADVAGRTFSRRLEDAVARSLAKSADDRFPNAGEFAGALLKTPEGRPPAPEASGPLPASSPPSAAAVAVREGRRRLPIAIGLLLVVAVAVGITAMVVGREPSGPGEPSASTSSTPGLTPTMTPAPGTTPTPADKAVAPPPGPRAGSTVPPEDIPGIEDVHRAIDAGRGDEAIRLLVSHRQLRPSSAYLAYLHGNVLFERMWWSEGFAAYEAAIKLNAAYREDPVLIKNVLRTLWSDKAYRRGTTFLIRIGKPALEPVRELAVNGRSAHVRSRAAYVARRIQGL
jgi:eukaryotic-like serine/threonine-protein kinase